MWCGNCGAQLKEGSKFCTVCGAPVAPPKSAQPVQPAGGFVPPTGGGPAPAVMPPKRRRAEAGSGKVKKLLPWLIGGAAALAVLIVAIVLLSSGALSPSSGGVKDVLSYYYVDYEADVIAIMDKDGNVLTKEAWDWDSMDFSGSRSAVLVREPVAAGEEAPPDNTFDMLYLYSGGKLTEVTKKPGLLLDAKSSTLLYLANYDEDSHTGTLMKFVNGKEEAIERNVLDFGCVLSPNGKSMTYLKGEYDKDSIKLDSETFYIARGGAAQKLGNNCSPVAIADNGGMIYYYKYDGDVNNVGFYVNSNKFSEVRLANSEEAYSVSDLSFNRDLTELIFCADGDTYISLNGDYRERLDNDASYQFYSSSFVMYGPNALARTYDTDSLKSCWFVCDGDEEPALCRFIGSGWNCEQVMDEAYDVDICDSAKACAVLGEGGELKVLTAMNGDVETATLTRERATDFFMSDSGKTVYYLDDDDNLYVARAAADWEDEKVASDIYSFYIIPGTENCVMLRDYDTGEHEGILMVSRNGEKPEKVEGGGDVSALKTSRSAIYVYKGWQENDDGYEWFSYYDDGFVLVNGRELKRFASDCGIIF